ncbi:MAG: M15 family metallopeptidase [Leptospirales bacterium]|nr:M15 family metallopeptidase [Leptospirales bacterium]
MGIKNLPMPFFWFSRISSGLLPVIFLMLAAFPLCSQPPTQASIYGPVKKQDYLLGKFQPTQHPAFVKLSPLGIPVRGEQMLRREAADALRRMYQDLHREHPKVEFWVQSSSRNWFDQKAIWESKWNGTTLVEGKALNKSIPDPLSRARKILEFSSMPGTSRHHWGTDLDINILTNVYYQSGNGAVLYQWLQKNAANYGYCQVYTAGRKKGYLEERWHWSYLPVSKILLKDWKEEFGRNTASLKGFEGFQASGSLAPVYVESINPNCQ